MNKSNKYKVMDSGNNRRVVIAKSIEVTKDGGVIFYKDEPRNNNNIRANMVAFFYKPISIILVVPSKPKDSK